MQNRFQKYFSSFESEPNCQPKIQISLLPRTHYVTYELCFKCMGWMCRCAHEAAVFSPQTCRIPNLDYKQKWCALKLLPLDKKLLLSKCVLMQKVVHGKAPQYLKNLMIPSERLHVHGNKQLLPRTRIDIFKTSFSFSGSLAWNSLAHHLRYPMELKRSKGKHFRHLLSHLEYFVILLVLFFFFSSRSSDTLTQNVQNVLIVFPSLLL